jgi:N-acetylneuraminic acid mutarotase
VPAKPPAGGYGGVGDYAFVNTLARLDTTTGAATLATPAGQLPTPRAYHTWTTLGSACYVFGGRGQDGVVAESDPTLLCAYDTSMDAWVPLTFEADGPAPAPRSSHRAAAHNGRVVIFGGAAQGVPNEVLESVHT